MMAPHLTTSHVLAGLQCTRRLWLLVNEPPERQAPTTGTPPDVHQEIRLHARELFAGGEAVDERAHLAAERRTKALMGDARVRTIFGAAFAHRGVRVRVDILERLPKGNWGVRVVKTSSGPKDHYFDEIALQAYVLKGCKVPITSFELLHVNTSYVRSKAGIRWKEFFTRLDIGAAVAVALAALPSRLPAIFASLSHVAVPHAEPGSQCSTPYECDFWDRCTEDKPEDWVFYMPRLSAKQKAELKQLGIESISAIPDAFELRGKQATIRDVTVSGRPFIAPDLGRLLGGFGPPACYLDFEAMMPPIPLHVGTRPYQPLPFQWSLHRLGARGKLTHREFLAPAGDDPRRPFTETLVAALAGSDTPIVVYSSYEQSRLKELAQQLPDLRGAINAIIDRLVDLLPVVRGAVYFPEFRFSNSIKSVGPALCPDFGYDDLDGIADGLAAAEAFLDMASGRVTEAKEVASLRLGLLAYCKRDTLAMVEVHRALIDLLKRSPPGVLARGRKGK